MNQLPIEAVVPELLSALRASNSAVLVAEPGAGKTTRVPLALLDEPWLAGQRIIMLEPRRLAARSAAIYMAKALNEEAGNTVGYRVRHDTRVGPHTRIEVVTEGVLTRMLQSNQALEGVGAILFDEFHERHLHSDLGLALSLQTQSLLRDDLRLLVMSATLDAEPIAALLGEAPIIRSKGRAFPVSTYYLPRRNDSRIEEAAAAAIRSALREHDGDSLVFLPGVGEIRRTAGLLRESGLPAGVRLAELHGNLPLDMQQAAIAACQPGERKIVLATSIAESSLTVEGVKIVVDCGLMRVPKFSLRTGMSRLETVPVSQASADQRRGRAGRLAPGVCYRLWTEQEHYHLPPHSQPEIAEADLSPLALELAVWGVQNPLELDWLTPPPAPLYRHAVDLLQQLRLIDGSVRPTGDGLKIAGLGIHPRLGAMLLKGAEQGWLRTSCRLAALLSERDLLPQERNADIKLRLDLLLAHDSGSTESQHDAGIKRVAKQAAIWEETLLNEEPHGNRSDGQARLGVLLACAFPDRIAQRRTDGRYLLANGRGAALPEVQPISRSAYLTACELDDSGAESRIRLASELSDSDIESFLSGYVTEEESVEWDAASESIRARSRKRLGAIILKETPIAAADVDDEKVADALLAVIRAKGLESLPLNKAARQLLARMRLMSQSGGDWPDMSEEALLHAMDNWLKPHIYGMRGMAQLHKLNMAQLLSGMLTWAQQQELEEQAPTHIVVPSGSRIPVDYSNPEAPVLAVRLQELFGLKETPRLARGRLPLTLHLLSPSQRPVQVTQDLRSFWEQAYFEVKKDLKGRYPKHYWPDDPYTAIPTNRAKPRQQ